MEKADTLHIKLNLDENMYSEVLNDVPNSIKEIHNICIICFGNHDLHNLFTSKCNETYIDRLLHMTTGVQVPNNTLPHKVCGVCVQDLVQVYAFQIKCRRANQVLSELQRAHINMKDKLHIPDINVSIIPLWDYPEFVSFDNELLGNNVRHEACLHESNNSIDLLNDRAVNLKTELEIKSPVLSDNEILFNDVKVEYDNLEDKPEKSIGLGITMKEEYVMDIDFVSALSKTNAIQEKKKKFTCNTCDLIFCTEWKKIEHQLFDHPSPSIGCTLCKLRLDDIESLKTHECKEKIKIRENLFTSNFVKIEDVYKCRDCNAEIMKQANLEDHLEVHCHKQRKCRICLKTIKEYLLALHYANHYQVFCCKVCNETFVVCEQLNKHILLMHKDAKLYFCKICGKGFPVSRHLALHSNTHFKKYFNCDICGNSFYNIYSLEKHKVIKHVKLSDDMKNRF